MDSVQPPIDDRSSLPDAPSDSDPPVDSPRSALCDSCGRFVGPYERCPYCGARIHGRLQIRVVKAMALLMATVGLALLWWQARRVEVPIISVAEATGAMNFAYVRLEGRISRNLSYDAESGYLGFWLDDGTGEAYVNAYRDVTAELLARGTPPAIGDQVSVAGTLGIREDYTSLTINVADHVTLDRPDAIPFKAGDVTLLDEGTRVRLSGEVRRIYEPYDGLVLWTIGDDSGEIVVAVDDVVTSLTGPLPECTVGQTAEVEGVITLYGSTPQIAPASVADIKLLPATFALAEEVVPVPTPANERGPTPVPTPENEGGPTPVAQAVPEVPPTLTFTPTSEPTPEPTPIPVLPLSQVDAQLEGQMVRVRGRIALLEGLKGGVKAALDDGTAQITLLLWNDVYQAMAVPTAFDAGADVEALGIVSIYEGSVEVIPADAADVLILVAAEPATWVEVAGLTLGDAGRVVRIRGVLGEPRGFSAGVMVPLNDGTGEITVVLWSDLYTGLNPVPQAGELAEIVGTLNVYREALELIPRSLYDWRVRPPDG